MDVANEPELIERATRAARKLAADLQRDAADLPADGKALMQNAALAARRVLEQLESANQRGQDQPRRRLS